MLKLVRKPSGGHRNSREQSKTKYRTAQKIEQEVIAFRDRQNKCMKLHELNKLMGNYRNVRCRRQNSSNPDR